MKRADIYISTDSSSTRKLGKSYGFVMEFIYKGEPFTREGFGTTEATYNRAVLIAINEALERFNRPCEIHIHSENSSLLTMIDKDFPKWKENGYQTNKGKEIKNRDEWQRFSENSREHMIVTEKGAHSYGNWIKEQIEKIKRMEMW